MLVYDKIQYGDRYTAIQLVISENYGKNPKKNSENHIKLANNSENQAKLRHFVLCHHQKCDPEDSCRTTSHICKKS